MLPIAMFLLQKEGQFLTGHDLFLKRIGAAYHAFLEESEVRPTPTTPSRGTAPQPRRCPIYLLQGSALHSVTEETQRH